MSELPAEYTGLDKLHEQQLALLIEAGYDLSGLGSDPEPEIDTTVNPRHEVKILFDEEAVLLAAFKHIAKVPYISSTSANRLTVDRRQALVDARKGLTRLLIQNPTKGYTKAELMRRLDSDAVRHYNQGKDNRLSQALNRWWREDLHIMCRQIIAFGASKPPRVYVNPELSVQHTRNRRQFPV